jgi:hypothetical protein
MTVARTFFPVGLVILLVVAVFAFILQPAPDIQIPANNSGNEVSQVIVTQPHFVYDAEFVAIFVEARIFEVYSGHAWQQHGDEVNKAFRCLSDKGSSMSFKTFGFKDSFGNVIPTNVWLCFDGTDWYAIVSTVFEKVGGNHVARLVTAYKVSKDLFPNIADYVKYLGSNWGARQINYIIEAGTILISPK